METNTIGSATLFKICKISANIFITSHVTLHLTLQNKELIDDLTKTKDELSGFNRMCSKQQIELDAAILQKNEKIKSCNRMELEVVIFINHYESIESKPY